MSSAGPCPSCLHRCCTEYTVSVTGYDAWLIGAWLGLPMRSFLAHLPLAGEAERGFLLEPRGGRFEIALDKTGRFQKGNPCVFLVDLPDGTGRCGIYASRPLVCRTYPAHLLVDVVDLREDRLCPVGGWALAGMDLPVFRRGLQRLRLEQDIYAYVVARWNRRVEGSGRCSDVGEYYDYLNEIYGLIETFRAGLAPLVIETLERDAGRRDASAPNPFFVDLAAPRDGDEVRAGLDGIRSIVDRCAHPDERERALARP